MHNNRDCNGFGHPHSSLANFLGKFQNSVVVGIGGTIPLYKDSNDSITVSEYANFKKSKKS